MLGKFYKQVSSVIKDLRTKHNRFSIEKIENWDGTIKYIPKIKEAGTISWKNILTVDGKYSHDMQSLMLNDNNTVVTRICDTYEEAESHIRAYNEQLELANRDKIKERILYEVNVK